MVTSKRTKPITGLGERGVTWQQLAAVIVERALLEERAKALTPEKAANLRVSEGAVQLEHREGSLWEELCLSETEYLLYPVKGGVKNRQKATTLRLRYIFTSMSTALLDEARKGFRAIPKQRHLKPQRGKAGVHAKH